ncbi:MAG: UDP-N-acetylmuramoyl-tripeptide--D-alanyl-D-alanine ligase [Bowdeniella nasicola]|nr:UDP-N-acetylmuramoyl-tripeptide--D-alanyl-D-alanine ligase [Bowdeniella nasicola]
MIALSAAEIAEITGGVLAAEPGRAVSGDVHTDSRLVRPGDLFVAIVGESQDGHAYIPQALKAGATLVLSDREVAAPHVRVGDTVAALGALAAAVLARLRDAGELTVVGITGSAGKTTTKDLLGAILSAEAETVWPEKSFNNDIGLPLTVLRAAPTTRYLVTEMGAAAEGELTRLTFIAPLDVACVLMVGHAHVGGFGSIEDVARAKAELVERVRPGGTVVLNGDDERVAAMAGHARHEDGSPVSDVRLFSARRDAADLTLDELGRAHFTYQGIPVEVPIPGAHHVANALAALTIAEALGVPGERAAAALGGAQLSAHRMDITHRADGVTVLDDAYNANPESMRAALISLAALPARRRIAVLGAMLEMGEEADGLHRDVGQAAAEAGIDVVYSVGADPIAEGARAGGVPEVWAYAARTEADAALAATLRSGDTVLFKGSNGTELWASAERLAAGERR